MLCRMIFITLAVCLLTTPAQAAPLHDAALKGDAAQIKAPLDWAAFRGAYIPV